MFGIGSNESSPTPFAWGVILLAATAAAIWDARTGRIPNALTIPLLVAGLVWSAATGGGSGMLVAFGSSLLLALPCFLLFLFAGGGAGDVKLLGALGAWLSLSDAMLALVCVAAAGVLCGFLTAIIRRRSAVMVSNLSRMMGSFAFALTSRRMRDAAVLMPSERNMQPMPYGVAIALGMWVCAAGRWFGQW